MATSLIGLHRCLFPVGGPRLERPLDLVQRLSVNPQCPFEEYLTFIPVTCLAGGGLKVREVDTKEWRVHPSLGSGSWLHDAAAHVPVHCLQVTADFIICSLFSEKKRNMTRKKKLPRYFLNYFNVCQKIRRHLNQKGPRCCLNGTRSAEPEGRWSNRRPGSKSIQALCRFESILCKKSNDVKMIWL